MALEDRPGRDEYRQEADAAEAREMVQAETDKPVAPRGMSDDEAQKIQIQAMELVRSIGDAATGSTELKLFDGIANVGIHAQRNAAKQLDLLKTRVGTFLNEGGTSEEIAEGLRDLRLALNQINPAEMTHPGIGQRVVGVLPFFKGRFNPMVGALNKIALRYEPVSRQVGHIESKLRDARGLLVRDNVELRKVYEDVESQQLLIRRNAYLGELLIEQLDQRLVETDDPAKEDRIQNALHVVAMRVQGLRTMEEVHVQYFVSIEMTRQNNSRLGQSVEQTLTLTTNVVTVGLAIQSALVRQKRVMEATQRTREFLGTLVAANAAAIRQHTDEIGDLYHNPVIAMDKIAEAHNDLVEALNTAGRLRQEGIEVARENIGKLTQMSGSLEHQASGLLAEAATEIDPVEA